jgi:uncharacterized protein YjbI with pentapeptide repeats
MKLSKDDLVNEQAKQLLEAVSERSEFAGKAFIRADFRFDFSGANLRGIVLSEAKMAGLNLNGADLSGAELSGIDLSGADLRLASLKQTILNEADLSGADLFQADLRGAILVGADRLERRHTGWRRPERGRSDGQRFERRQLAAGHAQ